MPDTKPWKPSRRERRVLLALLAGAANLSGFPLCRVAQVSSGRVYITLARLERRGWAFAVLEKRTDGQPRRRFYHLTPEGRQAVMGLLGLEEVRG